MSRVYVSNELFVRWQTLKVNSFSFERLQTLTNMTEKSESKRVRMGMRGCVCVCVCVYVRENNSNQFSED
jgi:hypothetical protein